MVLKHGGALLSSCIAVLRELVWPYLSVAGERRWFAGETMGFTQRTAGESADDDVGCSVWHGILFEEPNPTGNRPRDLIGLEEQQKKPHPPNTQGRARREHGEAGGGREKMEGPKIVEALRGQRGGDQTQRSPRPETTGRESASN